MFLKSALPLLFAFASLLEAVEIRVATFNIGANLVIPGAYFNYGIGAPGTPDHDTVRDVLGRIDADVVALEEIHGADFDAGHLTALATGLGYPHVFFAPNTNAFDPSLHVAFLSRFPFLSQTLITSPAGSKDMTRLIPAVKVDVPGTTRDPVLIGAHLKAGGDVSDLFQRTVEMRRLTNYLSSGGLTADDNFLIIGDFNLSDSDRTFTSAPASGLPAGFSLGPDITFPISYFTNPLDYFGSSALSRIVPRQLNDSTFTFKSKTSGTETTIDLYMVSPIIGSRPLRTEIYNSALDTSNTAGLPKAGSPLAAGTSAAASDHLALFGDIELDPAQPYAFTAPGETVTETFDGFPGTYDPYPWATTGGAWQGVDDGSSTARGFRTYGPAVDPSLGALPGAAGSSVTASFANQSTEVLSALQVSYTAEQWRSTFGGTDGTVSVELIVGGVPQPLPQLTFNATTNLPNGSIAGGTSAGKGITVGGLSVAPGEEFQLRFTFTPGAGGGLLPTDVFINEFNYLNTGEFIEVVVGPGYSGSISDISVLLYNGNGGATYGGVQALASFDTEAVTASGHRIYSKEIAPIQNGDPDGFALVVGGAVTRFISYGGPFIATAGLASGMTSSDIGEKQLSSDVVGQAALGFTGTGGSSANFSWTKFTGLPHSPGQPNSGQTFTVPKQPQGIAIDNLAVTFLTGGDTDGDGITDADEAVFGTDPADAGSRFVMSFANQTPALGMVRLLFLTETGRSYTVESCTDFSDWEDEETYSGTGSPHVVDFTVSPEEPKRFYRIRVTLTGQ